MIRPAIASRLRASRSVKAPDIRVALGAGGSGKTHLVNHWLDKIGGRALIFNPNAEETYSRRSVPAFTKTELMALVTAGDHFRVSWAGLEDDDFEFINEVAWCARRVTLVWEEADIWIGPTRLPTFARRIINQGRHRDIRVIACARRPAQLARDVTANASRICAFRTQEPRDVQYLRDFIGPAADQLPNLPTYTAVDWTPNGAKTRKSPFR